MSNSITNEETKIFSSCDELHIFPNANGAITLIQKTTMDGEQLIVIPVHYVELVIDALRKSQSDIISQD